MTKITKDDIELLAVEQLEDLAWEYLYALGIGPDSDSLLQRKFEIHRELPPWNNDY